MTDLKTIPTTDLDTVQGGNALARGAVATWNFVKAAFRPAGPLTNAKEVSDYATQVGKNVAIPAAGVEIGTRAVTGKGVAENLGLGGGK